MNTEKKKVVVTGGLGTIGRSLVEKLVADGNEVHIVDNKRHVALRDIPEGATLWRYDINKYRTMAQLLRGADIIFHLAALPDIEFSFNHPHESAVVNATGTISVLTASEKMKVKKFIFASSDLVRLCDPRLCGPPLALQKKFAEDCCESSFIPTACLRLPEIRVPIQNAVDALIRLSSGKQTGIFNLSSEGILKVKNRDVPPLEKEVAEMM